MDVDGTRWRQVPDFGGSGSDDQHYMVHRGAHGGTVVEFGDGVHGGRPSSGASIGVRYRAGTRYSSVLLQQGRVILDADVGETPPVVTWDLPGHSHRERGPAGVGTSARSGSQCQR